MSNKLIARLSLAITLPLLHTTAHTYDVNDTFSLGGVLAGAVQCRPVPSSAKT